MKTKAIVIPAANTIEMREVELKPLGAEDVLIRTRRTGISAGTERMLLKGVMPHPMLQFPVVPGYETAGDVIDAGASVQAWLGKRVYVGGNYGFVGVNPAFGGQSQYIVAPASHLTDLQTLSDAQGVTLALTATALHGVDLAGFSANMKVLVLGQGVVGQLAARIAKMRGARVLVTDPIEARLRLSDADAKMPASSGQPALPPEFSPIDVLIDASGKMDAIAARLMSMKKGGRVVLLGYYDKVDLPYQPIFLRELTLAGSMQWAAGDLIRARDLIESGQLDVAPLLTHEMDADNAAQAFEIAFNDPTCIKMSLIWPDGNKPVEQQGE